MTDALTLLKEDHRNVEQLFRQFEQLADGGETQEKERIVESVTRELSIHASIEEQIFYPAVRAALPEGDEVAEHLIDEHHEVKEALAGIENTEASSPEYDGKVQALIGEVRHHVEEEEGEVFPKIADKLSPETLEQMGEALEKGKKTAPTHPHPNAPSTPPANVIAGPPAAAMDRMRDGPPSRKGVAIAAGVGAFVLLLWRRIRRRRKNSKND